MTMATCCAFTYLNSQRPLRSPVGKKIMKVVLLVKKRLVHVHLCVELGTSAKLAKQVAFQTAVSGDEDWGSDDVLELVLGNDA